MISLAFALLVADAPKHPLIAEHKIKSVAVLPLTWRGKSDRAIVEVLDDLLLAKLQNKVGREIRVVGKSDMEAVLSLEKSKDMLGCSQSSCMVEIAGALGVDSIISGSIGTLGKKNILNVSWITQRNAQSIARFSETLSATVDGFDDGVLRAVQGLLGESNDQVGLAEPDFRYVTNGRCEVVLPAEGCPAHKEYKGSFTDSINYSSNDPWHCQMRATDWYYWCGTSAPVSTRFFEGDELRKVTTSTACEIALPDEGCPKHAESAGVLRDNFLGSAFHPNRCRERAAEWFFWCGTKQPVRWTFRVGNEPVQHGSFSQ